MAVGFSSPKSRIAKQYIDNSAGADKTFTVADDYAEVQLININVTATATSGNRQIEIYFYDSTSNYVYTRKCEYLHAPSAVVNYIFSTSYPVCSEEFYMDGVVYVKMPSFSFTNAQSIFVRDASTIDASDLLEMSLNYVVEA